MMRKLEFDKLCSLFVYGIATLSLALASCGSNGTGKVKIERFGPVESVTACKPGDGMGVAVLVKNPDKVPLTYVWITSPTPGKMRVSSNKAPAGTYDCPDTAGTETITVQVVSEGNIIAQESMQIVVAAPPSATHIAPAPETSHPTLAPATKPIDTAVPNPSEASQPTRDGPVLYLGSHLQVTWSESEIIVENISQEPLAIRISWDGCDPGGNGAEGCRSGINDWVLPGKSFKQPIQDASSVQCWAWDRPGENVDMCNVSLK